MRGAASVGETLLALDMERPMKSRARVRWPRARAGLVERLA